MTPFFGVVAFVPEISLPTPNIFGLALFLFRASFLLSYTNHSYRVSNPGHFFGVLMFVKSFPGFEA
jgi:hypothetical protein